MPAEIDRDALCICGHEGRDHIDTRDDEGNPHEMCLKGQDGVGPCECTDFEIKQTAQARIVELQEKLRVSVGETAQARVATSEARSTIGAQRIVIADLGTELNSVREKLNEAESNSLYYQEAAEKAVARADRFEKRLVAEDTDLGKDIRDVSAYLAEYDTPIEEAFGRIKAALLRAAGAVAHDDNCNSVMAWNETHCDCGVDKIEALTKGSNRE